MDRGLDSAHEAGTHVDTASTERKSTSKTLTISVTTRSNEGYFKLLGSSPEENEVGDIVFTDVTSALEAVNREEVDTHLLGGQSVADSCALVEDGDSGGLELLDDLTGRVSSSFDWDMLGIYGVRCGDAGHTNLDALVNDDLGIGIVVRRNHGREEGKVHAKRLFGHGAAAADFLAEILSARLSERGEKTKTAGVGNSGGELSV